MRRISFFTMISLDGYMEKPGGSLDWISVDDELLRFISNLKRGVGGYLCGRGMYENNEALWSTAGTQPGQGFDVELAQNWKQTPKIVFSGTLERVEGNATLERGDPVAVVAPATVPKAPLLAATSVPALMLVAPV